MRAGDIKVTRYLVTNFLVRGLKNQMKLPSFPVCVGEGGGGGTNVAKLISWNCQQVVPALQLNNVKCQIFFFWL